MIYDDSFSKFNNTIKFRYTLRPNPIHHIEDLWQGPTGLFAFYRYSGLRAITTGLYSYLSKEFGEGYTETN